MKHTIKNWLAECRKLSGDPRYIGRGMAIGVFVSMTPFFPFHTAIAVTMSVFLRGSKRAAAVAVWLSNPLTIPICYFIIYKLGITILGTESIYDPEWKNFTDLLKMGVDIVYAMIVGGFVLGTALGIPTYYATKKIFQRMQRRSSIPDKQTIEQVHMTVETEAVKNPGNNTAAGAE
jgi:uncharacterized protein (DUF2062 family)